MELLRRKEEELWKSDTNMQEIQAQMDRLKPDAALSITPFLANEEMAMRVCSHRGLPLCTSILSFDNITTRGWMAVPFDRYLVWNRYNAEELLRAYPEMSPVENRNRGLAAVRFLLGSGVLLVRSRNGAASCRFLPDVR